ncbi:MAG: ABC transporter ATP-binding protein [Propioniciclava sp.]|uniref:ABC transporter ATP-binding protein n=1 Tax=Propioniciclava sp. TaxID=2038686 RepID=UPI0039E5C9AA
MSAGLGGIEVRTENLTCGNDQRPVLTGVNLDVPPGTFLALVGPNGSGKSTLLRALAGIRPAMAGAVFVGGRDLARMPARSRGRHLAMVAQDEKPNEDMSLGELVALGLTPHRNPWSGPRSQDRVLVAEALGRVGLGELIDRPVHQTSGGELRRAVLARGLIQQAPVLLLDEPTNHLDVEQQLALLNLVRGLDRTVIAAIHDLDLAAAFFDRVALLDEGSVVAEGTPSEVLGGIAARDAFHIRVAPVRHPHTQARYLLLDSPAYPRPTEHQGEHHP